MTAVLVPIPVSSVAEEDRLLGQCECGGRWHLVAEEVAPINRRWYDALVLKCEACGETNRAIFDITRFFQPMGNAWARVT